MPIRKSARRRKPKKSPQHKLIVVAHPDDETIFFGGLLQTPGPWHVCLCTDANADGFGATRMDHFKKVLKKLKVQGFHQYQLPDVYERRLNQQTLQEHLSKLPIPSVVFTHNILGEYGHPHHQDVSYAVHKVFHKKCEVWSTAYNLTPEMTLLLDEKQIGLKKDLLSTVYYEETKRFQWFLSLISVEGFLQLKMREIEKVYSHLTTGEPLTLPKSSPLHWFLPYLKEFVQAPLKRPF